MAEIEDTIVIQLAKFNDKEKSISNAVWSNHTKQAITINQGDQILISKSYIDTRNLSASGIVILEDTPLELEMFFYWINDGNPGSVETGFTNNTIFYPASTGDPPVPFPEYTVQLTLQTVLNINMENKNSAQQKTFADGRPYLMCYTDNSPFTQTWRYMLPKGTYTPDALATLLTTNMSEVKKQTAAALNKPNSVDWFDPFAPKVNLPTKTTLDQPFVVDTNSNSPMWALAFLEQDGTINGGDYNIFEGTVNSQPYIQIEQNNGLPDWLSGTSGYTTDPLDTPPGIPPFPYPSQDPNMPYAKPGPPPNPSLTFKNIISDCPIPNVETNLPPIPGGAVILASQMIRGLYYQIITLGDTTNWLFAGDTNIPPVVGDTFECANVPIPLPNPTIGFLDMVLYKTYKVVYSGLPWTGPGGFDTNWALYGNNGAINSTFATNAVQPTVIALTNSTDITLINVNITYTITASTNVDWTQFGASLPSNNPIPYTSMTVGSSYEIISLGLAYAPGGVTYDTSWAQLGDLEPTPIAIGNVFTNTKQYNIPIPSNSLTNIVSGITFKITATDDLINWAALGYTGDPNINNTNPIVPVIDPVLLVGYTYKIVSLGVYYGIINGQSYYDTNWSVLTDQSIPDPPGYTTPVVGDRFLTNDVIDVVTNVNNGALLNIVPNGQTLLVTLAGDINWFLYGTIPNAEISVLYCVYGVEYIVTVVGAVFNPLPNAPFNTFSDSQWFILNGAGEEIPNIGDSFICAQTITPLNNILGNVDTGNTDVLYVYQIVDLGTLTDAQWVTAGATSPAVVGQFFQGTGNGVSGGTVYNVLYWYVQVGFSITINNPGSTNWMAFGAPSNTAGITFTVTTGYTIGMNINLVTGEAVDFTINVTGQVALANPATPFEIVITSNPGNASPTDVSFIATSFPTGTVQLINSYQNLLPFTFTATATGVDNPNENYTYAGEVIGTGTVKSIAPTFPFTFKCTEIPAVLPIDVTYSGTLSAPSGTVDFALGEGTVAERINPNNPNFYIYPLKLVSDPVINTNFKANGGDENPYVLTMFPTQMINYNFPLVGSTEIELAFNDQANIFQWNYTHSPILQATAPTTSNIPVSFSEVVGIVNSFIPDANPFYEPQTPTPKGYVSSTCKLVAKSGCMFRRMEPKSFWFDTLGFSESLLVTDAELGLTNDGTLNPIALPADLNRFTYERFNSVTTRSLLSTAMNFTQSANYPNSEPSYIANMFYPNPVSSPVQSLNSSVIDSWYDYEMSYNYAATVISAFNIAIGNPSGTTIGGTSPSGGNYASPPQWNQTWYQALDQTVTIPASSTPNLISDAYGHYLLEVQGYTGGGLLNENQKYNVKSIVSAYYNNIGSFTTGPFTDPQTYTHVGEPVTLNNFRIRILNPKTMQEIDGLGNNSCIYLQINKIISQVEQIQV
jgi:hypothetical protein